jgi:hypothetical protein
MGRASSLFVTDSCANSFSYPEPAGEIRTGLSGGPGGIADSRWSIKVIRKMQHPLHLHPLIGVGEIENRLSVNSGSAA